MKTHVDLVLRDEARRFALRFACDDCAHWVAATGGADAKPGTCSNAWPTRVPFDAIDASDEVTFCKEFELGNPRARDGEER